MNNNKPHVVIIGFGDSGLLVAAYLRKRYRITGITPKPCLVSGQELGMRLSRPERWKTKYLMAFDRFKAIKGVTIKQGLVKQIDLEQRALSFETQSGEMEELQYDALVISTGVRNGFWRNTEIETLAEINGKLQHNTQRFAQAERIAVVGGGPSGVSSAANFKEQYPSKTIDFYFSDNQPLKGYHPKVREKITDILQELGVQLHPNHRAVIPEDQTQSITTDTVHWQGNHPPTKADIVLWTIGKLIPNNECIPDTLLNEQGFVKADAFLQVPNQPGVFTVGDIAASDPLRCSARNAGFKIVAHNIDQWLQGKPQRMKPFKPAQYRWGSILGIQNSGLRVFNPDGSSSLIPPWWVERLIFPIFVWRRIYRGVDKSHS